jgi:hypothetical protein
MSKAAEALQVSADEVERFIDDLKLTLKAPWTAEHRNAFAAAIGRLSQVRLDSVPKAATIHRRRPKER